MQEIKKQFVVDENNRPVAVQVDVETFEKMEALLEDYGLVRLMQGAAEDDLLDLEEARAFYKSLPKDK